MFVMWLWNIGGGVGVCCALCGGRDVFGMFCVRELDALCSPPSLACRAVVCSKVFSIYP
jgi:hypothetical protein